MNKKKKNFKVSCPNCEKTFSYYNSEFRPFCSEKCRMIDLGQWFSESYAIPSQRPPDEEDLKAVEEHWKQQSEDPDQEDV